MPYVQLGRLVGACAMAALVLLPPAACASGARCEPDDAVAGRERLGRLDVLIAARETADCPLQLGVPVARSELSGVTMSLDNGPLDVEYRWSDTAESLGERARLTLTPIDGQDFLMQVRARHALDYRAGTRDTGVTAVTGFDGDLLHSTATLTRETGTGGVATGVEVDAGGSLPNGALALQLEYGQWHGQLETMAPARRSHGALSLDLTLGDATVSTAYRRSVDVADELLQVYAAGATLPRFELGDRRHGVRLEAELSQRSGGDAGYAVTLTDERRGDYPGAALRFRQTAGTRYTSLSLTRAGDVLTLDGGVEISKGRGDADTTLTLAAEYRF